MLLYEKKIVLMLHCDWPRFFHYYYDYCCYVLAEFAYYRCVLQVHSHKNYKGRKRIIVRYKETILIIMYNHTRCVLKPAIISFEKWVLTLEPCTFFLIYSLYVHVCYKIVFTNVHISYLWVQIEKGLLWALTVKVMIII